ncbi:MAG: hypothetical protein KIS72_00145 [Luteimonas sp.]|nr:hypothetical protein [Luteimonas sp.]
MRPFKALWLGLLLAACHASTPGDTMAAPRFDDAWQAVTAAATPQAQREAIDAFLAANVQAGAPPLMVVVHRRDSRAPAPIDQALWEAPSDFEVTLRYGDERYSFVPLSRSSLEPLFRE